MDFKAVDVGPVYREIGDHLHDGLDQAVEGKVPGMTALFGYPVQIVSQSVDLAGHGCLHDQLFFVVDSLREVDPVLQEARVDCLKHPCIRSFHKQSVYLIGKVVPGSTEHRPAVRQCLGFKEYLFHDDVEWLVGGGGCNNLVIFFSGRCHGIFRSVTGVLRGAVHPDETTRL